MAGKRKLEVEILDTRKGTGFKDTERAAGSFGSKLAKVGKTVALGLGVAGVAAVGLGVSFVKAAEESQKVTRQTSAVVKSMGNVAHISADQVADLSEQLALKTGVDDEVIQSGENVLLTFGNIRNEVGRGNDIFTQATKTALDMSVALGSDLQGANIQLGKALNDPIKGITALQRVGVSFTQDQKDQIEQLVKHNDMLGAQKIILEELGKEFGGSAEAQATASDKMAVAWGNVQESLGEALLPVYEAFTAWVINEAVPWIEGELVPALEDFSDWMQSDGIPKMQEFAGWMQDHLLPAVQDVATEVRDVLVPALDDMVGFFEENPWAVKAVVALTGLALAFGGVSSAAGKLKFLGPLLSAVGGAVSWLAGIIGGGLLFVILLVVGAFLLGFKLIDRGVHKMGGDWSDIWGGIQRTVSGVWRWIVSHWGLLRGILMGPIGAATTFIISKWKTIWRAGVTAFGAIRDAIGWVIDKISTLIGYVGDAAGAVGRLLDKASGIGDAISGGFGKISGIIKGSVGHAAGGIIPGPVGAPNFRHFVHGGEVVLNPAQATRTLWAMANGKGGGGGGGTVVNNYITVQGNVWTTDQLVEELNKRTRNSRGLN
jgi:hypothetical protein